MSRDLNALDPEFREEVDEVLVLCKRKAITMIPFFTDRDVYTQAKLWRQSRSSYEIKTAIKMLQKNEAHFLAKVLEEVGPRYGRWATNSLPGLSFHNYGLAVDCFALVGTSNGKIVEWSSDHQYYHIYAMEAVSVGLTAGHFWIGNQDSCHVQKYSCRVLDMHNWKEIDKKMREKYE